MPCRILKPDPELSPKSLSSFQMPQFSETIATIPMRSDSVRFDHVPHTVRSDAKLYDNVPGVFDAVQYGTPCSQDFVLRNFFLRTRIKNL